MKRVTLLVLSDSHSRADRVREVIQSHRRADTVLFLGDGMRDLDLLDADDFSRVCAVRGNCDGFSFLSADTPTERLLRFGDYTVLMMHGHTHDVKSGLGRAVAYAAERGADVLVFGHTHVAQEQYLPEGTSVGGVTLSKPLYVLNPGSIGKPMGDRPTFGLIDLGKQGILLSHGHL